VIRRFCVRCLLVLALAAAALPFLSGPAPAGAAPAPCRAGCAAACSRHLETCVLGAGHPGRHVCRKGCAWY
jgi:hypothetical protein